VDRFNKLLDHDSIYVLGDIACMETPKYSNGHPQVANVAINQAKNLAKNLKRELFGKAMKPYEYVNLGSMATIGKHKAVVDLPFFHFRGYFAWFVWMFLHLMLILSVRNKIIIFINWAITYFTKDTSLRLILKEKD
jgi:NADH:ubiquinone reductase (H+-translocating)